MRLITKYQDFKSEKDLRDQDAQVASQPKEKPYQKSSTQEEEKPHRKTDKTPPQKPAAVATIPNWETY